MSKCEGYDTNARASPTLQEIGEESVTNSNNSGLQQEPKMTAFMSHDEGLMAAAKTGKDIYSSIAAIAFNKTYEECCEFYFDENGNKTDKFNKEGKERRSQAKVIVLGKLCFLTLAINIKNICPCTL